MRVILSPRCHGSRRTTMCRFSNDPADAGENYHPLSTRPGAPTVSESAAFPSRLRQGETRETHGKNMEKNTFDTFWYNIMQLWALPILSHHFFLLTRKPLLPFTFPGIPDEVAEVALLEVAHFERQRIHVRGGVRLPCGVLWNVSGKSSNGSVQLGKQSNKIQVYCYVWLPEGTNNMIVFAVFQCRDLHNRDNSLGANKRSDLKNPTVCALRHWYVQ